MKLLNIIGIILSVALAPLTNYFIETTNEVRIRSWFHPNRAYATSTDTAEITTQAGLAIGIICGFLIFLCIINLIKIKTNTTKTLSIIGITLLGVAFIWNLIMLSTPKHISFDEGGQIWFVASLIMTSFSITFLVQSIRYNQPMERDDILDDIV